MTRSIFKTNANREIMKIKNSSSEMKVCNQFLYIYIEFRIFILKYVFVKLWGILGSFFLCVKKHANFLSDRKWRYAINYRFPLALELIKIILKVSKSRKQILKFSFEPKMTRKIWRISALCTVKTLRAEILQIFWVIFGSNENWDLPTFSKTNFSN